MLEGGSDDELDTKMEDEEGVTTPLELDTGARDELPGVGLPPPPVPVTEALAPPLTLAL